MKYGFYLPSRGAVATPDNTIAIVKRAEELGGTFTLRSDPGKGTQVVIKVPC